MSRFVEKTFEALNSVLNNSGLFNLSQDKSFHKFQFHWAVDSNAFLSNLKNAETQQEEENIITACLAAMKKRLSDAEVSNAEVENMVKVCLICETMGYSASFIYVHSIKLAQKGNLQEKHTGYLATSFFLHPHHELVILLINTMQKDLCSSNYMEVLFSLTCICNLINSETVHNVLHLVQDRLNHEKADVRKLAVLALGHCLQLAGSQSADLMAFPKLEKALSDNELEVVAAAVQTIFKVVQRLPSDFTYLIDSLVDLQDQILLRRIPRSMNYSDIPAPWLQIDIIKMLSFLCKKPEHCQKLTSILKETLLQTGQHNSMCHAIMYEVIQALTHMETNIELTELVLSSVSTFLKSKNVNLKLIGIEALISVVKRLKPSITSVQQEIIMECLKLPDETLQLKTLELIYQLAN
ncbi:AP-4 complex subunit epsilon, partial [Stegodyphus mimosarum]